MIAKLYDYDLAITQLLDNDFNQQNYWTMTLQQLTYWKKNLK